MEIYQLVNLLPRLADETPDDPHVLFANQWLGKYKEAQRFYHNARHAYDVAQRAKDEFAADPLALREAAVIAGVFHDCLSGEPNHEERSAEIALRWMGAVNQVEVQRRGCCCFTDQQADWVKEMIFATNFSAPFKFSEEAARFADQDVANFLCAESLFRDSELVIQEFCVVFGSLSESAIRLGRIAWLQEILDTNHPVFKSQRYQGFNEAARVTIAETIRRLSE